VSLSATPAHAAITPQARAIVDRYVKASGGDSALQASTAVRVKGHLDAMRLEGDFEQWSQVPDKVSVRIHIGPLKLRTGYDGHSGWETDLNSQRVRALEGKELEKLQGDAYFENEMWAREGQGGGTVKQGTASLRDGISYQSIDVQPPVGPARRLWFSEKTGLLARIITRFDNGESDLWYSEYRRFGARRRATVQDALDPTLHVLLDTERAKPDRYLVDSVWSAASFEDVVFAPPASRTGPIAWLQKAGVAKVPFRYGTRHVWIKVSINGAPPTDFLLDTGASLTAIDRDYAAKIGLIREGEFSAQGMGGSDAASFARVRSIRVGGGAGDGVTLRDFKVGIVNLGEGHEEVMWRKIGGLLGYDFLSRFVVEIDYDRLQVTFRDPRGYDYRGPGEALDMKLLGGIPVVEARLGGECAGDFLVDVGNSFGVIVHGSASRRCGMFRATSGHKQVKILTGGVGASFANWLCRLDSLSLGRFTLVEPIAGLSLATRGMVGSKDLAGNIGNTVLDRFRCIFDYERKKLYLEPGQRYAVRDRYSRAGVLLVRLGQKVVVGEVLHGSPADEAGLKPRDEVTTIDGRPALDFTPEELDRLFLEGAVGVTHTFRVVQDGKSSDHLLTLADVL
jgi:hypothetical protein